MPYGYGQSYIQPWQSLGRGLRSIGALLGSQQREEEARQEIEDRVRAEALARSGAMTMDDAIAQGFQFENRDMMGDAAQNIAPRFAIPQRMDVAIPGTGNRPKMDDVGPIGPDKTIQYQPGRPVIGPTGIVQTDPGPNEAVGRLIFEAEMRQAMAGPQGPTAPVVGTPEWKELQDYNREKSFEEHKRRKEWDAEFDDKEGANKKALAALTYPEAMAYYRGEHGTREIDELGQQGHTWSYTSPSGVDIPSSVITQLAREAEAQGNLPSLPDEYLPRAAPIDLPMPTDTGQAPMMPPGPLPVPSPAMRPDTTPTGMPPAAMVRDMPGYYVPGQEPSARDALSGEPVAPGTAGPSGPAASAEEIDSAVARLGGPDAQLLSNDQKRQFLLKAGFSEADVNRILTRLIGGP